tara:strand:- start:128 stop:325 length:198 start_codon:yes stop_codon:yes gene_type:complete
MDHQVMEVNKELLGVTLVVVAVVLVDNLILVENLIQVFLLFLLMPHLYNLVHMVDGEKKFLGFLV